MLAAADAAIEDELREENRERMRPAFLARWPIHAERPGHSTRHPSQGLGRLSYEDAMAIHTPGVSTRAVAQAAGVTEPSVSRWRKANGLVQAWVRA